MRNPRRGIGLLRFLTCCKNCRRDGTKTKRKGYYGRLRAPATRNETCRKRETRSKKEKTVKEINKPKTKNKVLPRVLLSTFDPFSTPLFKTNLLQNIAMSVEEVKNTTKSDKQQHLYKVNKLEFISLHR